MKNRDLLLKIVLVVSLLANALALETAFRGKQAWTYQAYKALFTHWNVIR